MGFRFKLPQHLRDSLNRQFSKTEFDKRGLGKNWFSPTLDRSEQFNRSERFKPLIAAMGYTPFQRRLREDAKTYFLYDRGPAKNFIYNSIKSSNNNSEIIMTNFVENETAFKTIDNTVPTFGVTALELDLIANHGVRVFYVRTDEADNLADNVPFIISCNDSSLLAVKTEILKSSSKPDFTIVKFNLITLRKCTDWESVVSN